MSKYLQSFRGQLPNERPEEILAKDWDCLIRYVENGESMAAIAASYGVKEGTIRGRVNTAINQYVSILRRRAQA